MRASPHRNLHPRIAVHCHNDRGLALANALDAYRAGRRSSTRRCSASANVRVSWIWPRFSRCCASIFDEGQHWDLTLLPELYDLVSRFAGIPIPATLPVMGGNAFKHCAGIHTQAAVRDPRHYQSLPPELVGRTVGDRAGPHVGTLLDPRMPRRDR